MKFVKLPLLFTLTVLLSTALIARQPETHLSWPEITRETKPWTRWWWPGSIVNQQDLTTAVDLANSSRWPFGGS